MIPKDPLPTARLLLICKIYAFISPIVFRTSYFSGSVSAAIVRFVECGEGEMVTRNLLKVSRTYVHGNPSFA